MGGQRWHMGVMVGLLPGAGSTAFLEPAERMRDRLRCRCRSRQQEAPPAARLPRDTRQELRRNSGLQCLSALLPYLMDRAIDFARYLQIHRVVEYPAILKK